MLEGLEDGNDSKNYEESGEKGSNEDTAEKSVAGDEQGESAEGHESNNDVKESKDAEKMDDSPVLGLLTGKKTTKLETEESKGVNEKKALSKGTIKTALRKRAQYLKANSEYASSFFELVICVFFCCIILFLISNLEFFLHFVSSFLFFG